MDNNLVKLAEITLKTLNKKKWDLISVDEVIKRSNLNKKNFIGKIRSKKDLLKNINRFFDMDIKKILKNEDQSNQKDMIFEIMMMRFDCLHKYRKSIINIFNFLKKNPKEFITLLPSFIESMMQMAILAKIPINGLKGNLKIKALLVVYFSSFLIWKDDNNKGLEKTMTSLDINLNRADNLLNIFEK